MVRGAGQRRRGDWVKGTERCLEVRARRIRFKLRQPSVITDDCFSVDDAGPHGQGGHGGCGCGKPSTEVATVARNSPYANNDLQAVVLDLLKPASIRRWPLAGRSTARAAVWSADSEQVSDVPVSYAFAWNPFDVFCFGHQIWSHVPEALCEKFIVAVVSQPGADAGLAS
jgi:hypothetical protein